MWRNGSPSLTSSCWRCAKTTNLRVRDLTTAIIFGSLLIFGRQGSWVMHKFNGDPCGKPGTHRFCCDSRKERMACCDGCRRFLLVVMLGSVALCIDCAHTGLDADRGHRYRSTAFVIVPADRLKRCTERWWWFADDDYRVIGPVFSADAQRLQRSGRVFGSRCSFGSASVLKRCLPAEACAGCCCSLILRH